MTTASPASRTRSCTSNVARPCISSFSSPNVSLQPRRPPCGYRRPLPQGCRVQPDPAPGAPSVPDGSNRLRPVSLTSASPPPHSPHPSSLQQHVESSILASAKFITYGFKPGISSESSVIPSFTSSGSLCKVHDS